MFLEVTTTHQPATDLGFLLHKNPARLHETELTFGKAWTCFPAASHDRCTAALILDVDPVGLVRGKNGADGLMQQYVNDRPYVASSFLGVAMNRAWREALSGKSRERQELADSPIPLEVRIVSLPANGGEKLIRKLFEPLGHRVTCDPVVSTISQAMDRECHYYVLTLTSVMKLSDALKHINVLIPVLDAQKHYYIGDDEVEKLMARGEGWLNGHPERELIVSRYLRGHKSLVREALERLSQNEDAEPADALDVSSKDAAEELIEKPLRLHDRRLDAVVHELKKEGAARVLDLGCGEGKLIKRLLNERQFVEVAGVEVSNIALAKAAQKIEKMPERVRQRVKLLQGALVYRDTRLRGYDAAALVEVIEHIEPERLRHMERAVFGDAAPRVVIVTTPNADYNTLIAGLADGAFRHADHRFEWTRAEFASWCERVASVHGYGFRIEPVGDVDLACGAPSQMAVFKR